MLYLGSSYKIEILTPFVVKFHHLNFLKSFYWLLLSNMIDVRELRVPGVCLCRMDL